jgi:hypothetical protein
MDLLQLTGKILTVPDFPLFQRNSYAQKKMTEFQGM